MTEKRQEQEMMEVAVYVEYSERKCYIVTVPADTDVNDIKNFNFDYTDEEISTQDEDYHYFSDEEEIVAISKI